MKKKRFSLHNLAKIFHELNWKTFFKPSLFYECYFVLYSLKRSINLNNVFLKIRWKNKSILNSMHLDKKVPSSPFGVWQCDNEVAVTFWHSCLPFLAWRRVLLCFFDPKQLLRVSCILRCYYRKFYSITFGVHLEY